MDNFLIFSTAAVGCVIVATILLGAISILVIECLEGTARRLRRVDPNVKILYFTGYSDWLFNEKKVLWENEAFVEKPVTLRGLLEAVSLSLFGHTRGLGR